MKIATSREAESDLDEMEVWLTESWGPTTAANVIETVLDRIEALTDMPLAGTLRPEYGAATRFVTSGRYVIYYETRENDLLVLRILHAALDRDAIMRKQD
ncbi:MAG: type II toxin-antitoxin system RelE/ParE family toxin [Terricaulis sp.]